MIQNFVVLFGLPGAGKGTQAANLVRLFPNEAAHVAPGEMYRDHIRRGTEMGRMAEALFAEGKFMPNEITVQLMGETILALPESVQIVLLDGFPRNIDQAEAFDAFRLERFPLAQLTPVYFDIPRDQLEARILYRQSCKLCRCNFNARLAPFQGCPKGICNGEHLVHRDDDNLEVLPKRLVEYDQQTAPMLEYYMNQGNVYRIDAAQTVEDVESDFVSLLFARVHA